MQPCSINILSLEADLLRESSANFARFENLSVVDNLSQR
jgi:hypothetical protein